MRLTLAIFTALAATPVDRVPPFLSVSTDILADDIVVSAPAPEPQVISKAIQSHEVDYATVTKGLVEVVKPIMESPAIVDRRIAAEAAHQ